MTKCVLCDSTDGVEMHHVKPKSQGGAKVKPLCHRCHGHIHGFDKKMSTSYLTRRALRRKIERGERVGPPPLGFDIVGGVLKKNPDEAEAVARILELSAEGYTLRRVAEIIDEEGFKTKRGGKWHPQTISRVLKANA